MNSWKSVTQSHGDDEQQHDSDAVALYENHGDVPPILSSSHIHDGMNISCCVSPVPQHDFATISTAGTAAAATTTTTKTESVTLTNSIAPRPPTVSARGRGSQGRHFLGKERSHVNEFDNNITRSGIVSTETCGFDASHIPIPNAPLDASPSPFPADDAAADTPADASKENIEATKTNSLLHQTECPQRNDLRQRQQLRRRRQTHYRTFLEWYRDESNDPYEGKYNNVMSHWNVYPETNTVKSLFSSFCSRTNFCYEAQITQENHDDALHLKDIFFRQLQNDATMAYAGWDFDCTSPSSSNCKRTPRMFVLHHPVRFSRPNVTGTATGSCRDDGSERNDDNDGTKNDEDNAADDGRVYAIMDDVNIFGVNLVEFPSPVKAFDVVWNVICPTVEWLDAEAAEASTSSFGDAMNARDDILGGCKDSAIGASGLEGGVEIELKEKAEDESDPPPSRLRSPPPTLHPVPQSTVGHNSSLTCDQSALPQPTPTPTQPEPHCRPCVSESVELVNTRNMILIPHCYVPLILGKRLTPSQAWITLVGAIKRDNRCDEFKAIIRWIQAAFALSLRRDCDDRDRGRVGDGYFCNIYPQSVALATPADELSSFLRRAMLERYISGFLTTKTNTEATNNSLTKSASETTDEEELHENNGCNSRKRTTKITTAERARKTKRRRSLRRRNPKKNFEEDFVDSDADSHLNSVCSNSSSGNEDYCDEKGKINKKDEKENQNITKNISTNYHEFLHAPPYTGVWKNGSFNRIKGKYIQQPCVGCKRRIRTYCSCNPRYFYCAPCFADHKAEVIASETIKKKTESEQEEQVGQNKQQQHEQEAELEDDVDVDVDGSTKRGSLADNEKEKKKEQKELVLPGCDNDNENHHGVSENNTGGKDSEESNLNSMCSNSSFGNEDDCDDNGHNNNDGKENRNISTIHHEFLHAPPYTGVWKNGSFNRVKSKYIQQPCAGCKRRIRTYCSCNPRYFFCAPCFADHKADVISSKAMKTNLESEQEELEGQNKQQKQEAELKEDVDVNVDNTDNVDESTKGGSLAGKEQEEEKKRKESDLHCGDNDNNTHDVVSENNEDGEDGIIKQEVNATNNESRKYSQKKSM